MSKNFAIMRTEKIKDLQATSASGKHNLRTGNYGDNVDPSRSHLNRYIISPKNNDLNEQIKSRFAECDVEPNWYGNKHKNNSVIALEIFMGVSNGFFDDKKPEVLDEWIDLNKQYLVEKYGEKNIASLVLHYDETTPHLQAHITPVVEYEDKKTKEKKFKLSAKEMIGGHRNRHHLEQTNYAKRFESIGLKRGQEHSKDRNVNPKEFTRIMNIMNNEVEKVQYEEIKKPTLLTNYKKYRDDLQEKFDFLADQASAYKAKAMIEEGKVNGKTFRDFEKKIKEKDKRVKKLNGLVKKRDKKIESLIDINGDLREETENLFGQRVNLQDENKELKHENESLRAENKELRLNNKKLTRKLEPKKKNRDLGLG